jgi:superfamily I DNA/RNA helicase
MGNSKIILSKKQNEIIEATENIVVNACPGSGKTFSVAARIAHLLKERDFHHQGIAAISFTNTAWQEIEKKLNNDFEIDTPIQYPHFLGTIDSFLNKYVFLPFGHLILGCEHRPIQVGEPHQTWSVRNHDFDYDYYFDKVSYNKEKQLIKLAPSQAFNFKWNKNDGTPSQHVKHLKASKRKWLKKGYANQTDSNYIAMWVLNKYPLIARNIANRFPYLIIDEAQDTTDVQMEIVDLLKAHTKEIMLIGDSDQAIFEWNSAKPELFQDKIKEWGEIQLFENRRSSQKICDCANAFIENNKSIPFEDSEVKSYTFKPRVEEYTPDDNDSINKIKADFLKLCKEHLIEDKNIAIIYRSKSLGNFLGNSKVSNKELPWKDGDFYVKDIIRGKYLLENGDTKKGFKYLENGYFKATTGQNYLNADFIRNQIAEKGFIKYRQEIFSFMNLLPSCKDKKLDEWIEEASKALDGKYEIDFPIKEPKSQIKLDCLFGKEEKKETKKTYHVGTIHSVKGETYDAVLLFLKKAAGNKRNYQNLLKECKTEEDGEEKRIVYVGLTRARKLLVLAVPEGYKDIWMQRLNL